MLHYVHSSPICSSQKLERTKVSLNGEMDTKNVVYFYSMLISRRIQETEERISDAEDTIENIDTTVKENEKWKNLLTQNIQEIQDTMRRPNLKIIGIDESEDLQLKGPANIFNKIMEENFPNLKREMPMNIQAAYTLG